MAGYCNAIVVVVALLLFPSMVLASSTYNVGGGTTWGDPHCDYQAWADSIIFFAGDSLSFIFEGGLYSVMVASGADTYNQCSIDHDLGEYGDGDVELTLPTVGTYYFFDYQRCADGMKFFVVAH